MCEFEYLAFTCLVVDQAIIDELFQGSMSI